MSTGPRGGTGVAPAPLDGPPGTARPRVSVLLPVYNAAAELRAALNSVLTQTWTDLEVIAVDDGSTDTSGAILDECAAADPRVRVIHRPNGGVVSALNLAIEQARGEYLARSDADDLNHPDRFRRQVAFLDAHPAVVAVGTGYRLFGRMNGEVRLPAGARHCRERLLVATTVAHATSMIRRTALQDHAIRYRPGYAHAEDFRLFSELAAVGDLANLQDVLYQVRIDPGSVSGRERSPQQDCHLRIVRENLEAFGVPARLAARTSRRLGDLLWVDGPTGPLAVVRYLTGALPALACLARCRVPGSVWWFLARTVRENVLLSLRGATPGRPATGPAGTGPPAHPVSDAAGPPGTGRG